MVSNNRVPVSGITEYLTPKFITDALGPFDLDVAAPVYRPWEIATECFTGEHTGGQCGLKTPWHGFVWCNPPYGKRNGENDFIEKMARHNNGFALVSSKTETVLWHDTIWPCHSAILFFRRRLNFLKNDGTPNAEGFASGFTNGSALIAFGLEAESRMHKLKEYGHIISNTIWGV